MTVRKRWSIYQISYLQGLRQKLINSNLSITITDIRPGFVDTGLANKKHFWMASKEVAAQQIFKIIRQRKNIGYVKKRWWLIAFLFRIIPSWIYNRI